MVVTESEWFEDEQASVERWQVLEDGALHPTMYGSTTWWHDDMEQVIAPLGLVLEATYGDLSGGPVDDQSDFVTLVLRRVKGATGTVSLE